MGLGIEFMERGLLPRALIRYGIKQQALSRLKIHTDLGEEGERERYKNFLRELKQSPIAIDTDKANQQHYELPPEFFLRVLGKHLKYSCCFWAEGVASLDNAEEAMLNLYIERAELMDGQRVLELGCGWGSLSLFLAERFPKSRIVAVSNSSPQREFITARAKERGIENLTVITADMNTFSSEDKFDRVVSIEMFEHMRNYDLLLRRIASWLDPMGKLFVHVFCHRHYAYPYESEGEENWMGRYFFTGGIMPSEELFFNFQADLVIESNWWLSGVHYQKTAARWLERLEHSREQVMPILRQVYGEAEAARWYQRWCVFFLACEELFGYAGGSEWGVAHYRFVPIGQRATLERPLR